MGPQTTPTSGSGRKDGQSRPQYHYFYGSTDEIPLSPQISESEILFGESLVPTDNEEEMPNSSARDLQQLVVTNGNGNSSGTKGGGRRVQPGSLLYQMDNHHESEPLIMTGNKSGSGSNNHVHLKNKNSHNNSLLHSKKLNENNHSYSTSLNSNDSRGWLDVFLERFLNVGGNYPVAHVTRVIVLVAMMIFMCTLVMVLKPRTPKSPTGATYGGATPSLAIPYPIVDRSTYGDPASKIINQALFAPSLLFNMGKVDRATGGSLRSSTDVDPILKVPFPTGAFWTNLVMKEAPNGFSYPIVSYPYAFQWSNDILQASYPVIRRRVEERSISDLFEPDVSFGTHEAISKRHITRFDPLSVALRFYTTGTGFWESFIVHGSPYITIEYNSATPVLKALSNFQKVMCPFDADGNYYDGDEDLMIDGLPSSRKLKWGVCTPSDGSGDDGTAKLHGVQFLIQTQENMTWILFASDFIEFLFDTRMRTEIVASQPFTGVLRLALIPPTADFGTKGDATTKTGGLLPLSVSSGLKRLVYHAGVYPVGGSVSWDFKSSYASTPTTMTGNALKAITGEISGTSSANANTNNNGNTNYDRRRIGTVHFKYETRLLNQNSNSKLELLTLGLPHHSDVLSADKILSADEFDLHYWCIKGRMIPVVGSTWDYDERLTTTTFDRDSDILMEPSTADLILKNVERDMKTFLPNKSLDIYAYGKQVARLAQLAHITKKVTRRSNSTFTTLDEITAKLHESLVCLLDGDVEDGLLYDAKFGGIVSKKGISNPEEDFGNGRYNDHHFHYGYILYASAVMGTLNTSFVTSHGAAVDSLLYDIGYKSNGDSMAVDSIFFPLARYKSWYDGHSFASGMSPFSNGKSQESSSEAVNGYYGAYLWSSVKNQLDGGGGASADFKDFLRLLLATEIRGAKTYWHMLPSPKQKRRNRNNNSNTNMTVLAKQQERLMIYNPSFRSNYMVGNLGMLDVVSSTYFAKELFYVHLINILPITAITAELVSEDYAEEQYKNVIAKAQIPNAWRGYAVCNQAIADPTGAWEEAQKLVGVELDSGLSMTQVLFFISTLEGFVAPNATISNKGDDDGETTADADKSSDSSSASCSAHPNCAPLLTGVCCPAGDGTMLACCQ